MHKAARSAVADGFRHVAGGQGGGKRHIAAGQRLAQTQNIRYYLGMFTGEQLAGAPETGSDLVGNQQHLIAVTEFAYPFKVSRVIDAHAARPLDHRFQDHRRHFTGVLFQQRGERGDIIFIPGLIETALRRGSEQVRREIALIQAVHRVVRIAYRHRAEGIAVIAVTQGQNALPPFPARLPVLQRHLQRHFHRHRSGIRQEHALQRFRRHSDQLATQFNRGGVGNAAEHHVRHLFQLLRGGQVQLRVVISVNGRPPGRHTVNQASAIGQLQFNAAGGLYRITGQWVAHRGVRVPDMALIEFQVGVSDRHTCKPNHVCNG
ncbi:hypothetical protein D3C80_815110 [compost metagenome]